MRLKPSEAVATVLAQVPVVAPESGIPAGCDKQRYVRSFL